MEYRYSTAVDPEELVSNGYFAALPVRKSHYEYIAVAASHQFHAENIHLLGEADVRNYTYDPKGHGVSLMMSETVPERIAICTYLYDYGLAADDMVDSINARPGVIPQKPAFADTYGSSVHSENLKLKPEPSSGSAQLEAKMILDVMAIDRDDAFIIMDKWKEWLAVAGTRRANDFKSFDEWEAFRYQDGAIPLMLEFARFGAGLKVSDEVKRATEHIVHPVELSAALINDYYSFKKESMMDEKEGSTTGVPNSVWILMNLRGIDVEEAKRLLLEIIAAHVQEYSAARESYEKANPNLPQNVKAWLDIAGLTYSGVHYWSAFSYRYHRYDDVDTSAIEKRLAEACKSSPVRAAANLGKRNLSTEGLLDLDHSANGTGRGKRVRSDDQTLVGTPASIGDTMTFSFTNAGVREISDETVLAPFKYISSLPSKGVREAAIKALNIWLDVPAPSLLAIRKIIDYLHSSSLMLDDIQDHSVLRRGKPTTHLIFGEAQTINSANFLFTLSLDELHKLQNPDCQAIYNLQLRNLHIGQGMDLHWTQHVTCPTVAEYVGMIDYKTGGLFNLVARLMRAEGQRKSDHLPIDRMMMLLGRYFQIRDDYQNLESADYTAAKGFCEDLDEGKFSLALIHTLQKAPGHEQLLLRDILQQHKQSSSGMSFEMKSIVLGMIQEAGSLDYVKKVLKDLQDAIDIEIKKVEEASGVVNYVLRLLVERLRIE